MNSAAEFARINPRPAYRHAWRVRLFQLVLLAFVAAFPRGVRAESETDFDAANRLYEEGKYADAAAAYGKLCQGHPGSAALWFNLGNANLKSGRVGRAIAAYREAQAIDPRDPDIRANLQFARNQVHGPTLSVGRWDQWLGRMTLNEWTLLTAVVLWLWILLLALLQWRPQLRPTLRWYVAGLAAGVVVCGVCLGAALHDNRAVRVAIVITPESEARQGPFDESRSAFTVQDGAELRVLDRKEKWLQVSNGQRRVGWLRQDQAVITSGASRS